MTVVYQYLLSQCFSDNYSNPRHCVNIGLSLSNSLGLSLNNSIGLSLNNSMSLNNSIGLSLDNSIVLHVHICMRLCDHTGMGFSLQTTIE